MFLLVDLSEKDVIHLALFDDARAVHTRIPGKNRDVVAAIAAFLDAEQIAATGLRGVMAVTGEGGFTSTRIAAVAANAFAYALRIPALAVEKGDAEQPSARIGDVLRREPGTLISARYYAEPAIGRKS
jgi:tRNA A37 threonylcarbamoyladenosine modification protein TsaB